MSEHPNVQKLREGYDAFKTKDMDKLGELFADDIVWHVFGTSPLSGDYKGKDEVFGFFMKSFEMSGGTLTLETEDFMANDQRGAVLVRSTAQREGKSLDSSQVHIFQMNDEGKVAEFWGFTDDTAAASEFWS